ncbi:MAG: hypothetical protein M1827_002510 [Pycnora praestabilis]|nr:MAG: hypothetical protein M1827_002510 [Pycnora praestabilis]
MASPNYGEIAAVARSRRDASIPAEHLIPGLDLGKLPKNLTSLPKASGHFTNEEIEMMESQAEDILVKIRERIWTALEVVQAFCKAAAVAHQLTNCLTETLFPEAITRAKYLDDYIEKTGSVLGPLHGLPISLKDCFVTPPHPSSIGMAKFANAPTQPEDETTLVTILRNMGAVFYVKTNVPVAMMMMETNNNVWGETRNPIHKELSAGGSSGGEGALIAMRGSPLGLGTDIGGSIRIPSAWNYLYGLKPSFGRFPTWGGKSGIPGQEFVLAVNGPMSRSLESVQLYCRSVLSETVAPWLLDPKCLPIPWREGIIQPKGRVLRIGVVGNNDGLVTAHPPVERAVGMTIEALKRAGHEVFEWAPTDHPEIVKNLLAAFFDLGGAAIMSLLQRTGEPVFESMKPYEAAAQVGEDGLGPTKLRMMNLRRNQLQKAYLDRWQATAKEDVEAMDAIIMAATPWTACRLGFTEKAGYFGYTGVYSLLDMPSCTFPVTYADETLDKKRSDFTPLSQIDGTIQEDYDPSFYNGAPVSLQLVGRRLEEEKVLEMVEIVAACLKK